MADTTQDKTEQPTAKRLDDAAEKGQVAYSKELTGAVIFLAAIGALNIGAGPLIRALASIFHEGFALPIDNMLTATSQWAALGTSLRTGLAAILPIFGVAFAASIVPGLAQVGIRISAKRVAPDLGKLSPLKGLKRLLSLDSFITALQNILKMALVGTVIYFALDDAMPRINATNNEGAMASVRLICELVFLVGFRVAGGLCVLGIIDILYRRWKHGRDLMMTKEEVKQERKSMDGDPHIKGRIREIQRALALQRMQRDVRDADVVIRNPTHFAVALKYETSTDAAPRVVAKGRALMALTIIRLAEENGVSVVSNRPLARELYRIAPVGTFIPEHLFAAVAKILALVFRDRSADTATTHTKQS